jgi:prepilin-type N-terminal cleavage/methylation domain-containing protein
LGEGTIKSSQAHTFIVIEMKKQRGFTLLELIVTLAILAVVLTVGMRMTSQTMVRHKSAKNAVTSILEELTTAQSASLSRSTTARVVVTNNGNYTYTITKYASAAPTTTCSSAGTWSTISTATISLNQNYQIGGTGLTNTCFYRDGSSSGGTFIVLPTVVDASAKTTTITLTIATGFLDVVEN